MHNFLYIFRLALGPPACSLSRDCIVGVLGKIPLCGAGPSKPCAGVSQVRCCKRLCPVTHRAAMCVQTQVLFLQCGVWLASPVSFGRTGGLGVQGRLSGSLYRAAQLNRTRTHWPSMPPQSVPARTTEGTVSLPPPGAPKLSPGCPAPLATVCIHHASLGMGSPPLSRARDPLFPPHWALGTADRTELT